VVNPDPSVPDMIELSPRGRGDRRLSWLSRMSWLSRLSRGRRFLIAGVALAVIAAASASAALWPASRAAHGNPALASLIAQVTTVPVGISKAAAGKGGYVAAPLPVTGAPLIANGKPEVFYVGAEYCPYCAAQSWALLVALSRFGTFSGLATIRSAAYPPYPPLDTWTFHGSSYTSGYLAFVPVETHSNVPANPGTKPSDGRRYRELQRLTPAQQAIFGKYDQMGSIPFIDFGDKSALIGSGFGPALLKGLSWSQIAAALRDPDSAVGQAILAAADPITAAVCRLTGDRPADVCR
jgi:hypothetical protein